MSLPTYTGNTNYVQGLDNLPNDNTGLTPAQLKAIFDKFGTEFKAWLNSTFIPACIASNIPLSAISGIASLELQSAIAELKGIDDTNKAYLLGQIATKMDIANVYLKSESDAKYETQLNITTNRKLSASGDFTGTLNGMPIVQDQTGLSTTVADHDNKISILSANYNTYDSNIDSNGVYTVVDYKRNDGTLYMKSTLSNQSGINYLTDTWQFYNGLGTIVTSTKTWTLSYNANGVITTKEVI